MVPPALCLLRANTGPTYAVTRSLPTTLVTYKLEHVPIENVVVGEALAMEQLPEKLAEETIIWLLLES